LKDYAAACIEGDMLAEFRSAVDSILKLHSLKFENGEPVLKEGIFVSAVREVLDNAIAGAETREHIADVSPVFDGYYECMYVFVKKVMDVEYVKGILGHVVAGATEKQRSGYTRRLLHIFSEHLDLGHANSEQKFKEVCMYARSHFLYVTGRYILEKFAVENRALGIKKEVFQRYYAHPWYAEDLGIYSELIKRRGHRKGQIGSPGTWLLEADVPLVPPRVGLAVVGLPAVPALDPGRGVVLDDIDLVAVVAGAFVERHDLG